MILFSNKMLSLVKRIVSRLTGRDLLEIIANDDVAGWRRAEARFRSRFPHSPELLHMLRSAKAHRLCCHLFRFGSVGGGGGFKPDDLGRLFVYESLAMYLPHALERLEGTYKIAMFRSILLTKGYDVLFRYQTISDLYYSLTIGQKTKFGLASDALSLIPLQSMMVVPRLTCRHVNWITGGQIYSARELLLYDGSLHDPIFGDYHMWITHWGYNQRSREFNKWRGLALLSNQAIFS